MAKSTILMHRDQETTILPVATTVTCSKRKEGSFSLWMTEESEFGRITHSLVKRTRSVQKIIAALLDLAEWSDLTLSRGDLLDDVCPRLALIDRSFAEAVQREIIESLPTRCLQSEAA